MSPRLSAGLIGLLMLTGCSTYDDRFAYGPRPVQVPIVAPNGAPAVQALATIIGLRNKKDDVPRSIEVRIRFENVSNQPAIVDANSLEMFSADLRPFGRPILDAGGAFTIAPGQVVILNPLFPVPEPGADLNGVNLRFSVTVAGHTGTANATFTRVPGVVYYDDSPRVGVGFGVGHVHHWHRH
jgi:hypothetical protein